VSFRIIGDPGDAGRPNLQLGRVAGAQAGFEQRIARDGVQVLAHGSLVCPECDMPLALAGPIAAGAWLRCGFCEHTERARQFLAADIFDTLANEAQLVARIV
jgi:hypothetical protein